MTLWMRGAARPRRLAAVLFLSLVGAVGCGQKAAPETTTTSSGDASGSSATTATTQPKPADARSVATTTPAAPVVRDRLHQAFADATRNGDNPPDDAPRPPDQTVTKRSSFKLVEEVAREWDGVRFTSPAGKKIAYSATVETSAGSFQIALFPEQAPNHVRNFICLAKVGYYEQLFCERVRAEQGNGQELRTIEAGCPLGTGETGTGSIGYWLKDEFTPAEKMTHDEGVLGACRGSEADTAATRFYITLNKAPFLDGNYTVFGKVIEGLDVVRKIYAQPVVAEDRDRDGLRRPEKPVVIRKVTIHAKEI